MNELPIPDLLQSKATVRIDVEATKLAITLAFAGSTSGGLFTETLDRAITPASTWEPNGFAADLFLQQIVTKYFSIPVGTGEAALTSATFLLRLLAKPPSDPVEINFRRDILDELVNQPALRKGFEALYRDLARLRAHFENTGTARRLDLNRHKLDTLNNVKQIFDRLAADFSSATSGLRRLGEFGTAMLASEPYRALRDLLSYDQQLATLNLKISVGADGEIRAFDVLSIDEAAKNPFVNPYWRRWLAAIELFIRGYKFSRGEVLARLIDSVFSGIDSQIVTLIQLVSDVEYYLGALGFRTKAQAAGLSVCLAEIVAPEQPREMLGLFNPLLLLNGITPVPCDIVIDPTTSSTLVTGPNSGGKTRLLQSLGLAQLLAQNGLFVPAKTARIVLATGLVTSIIEGTKADQAEGRLGMEMMRIRSLFERLPPMSMVLLDELCSGTNPSEGERIVELVLGMLHKLRPQAFVTTHFLAFAQRLDNEKKVPGLNFLQVELGSDRRATYQFKPGVAKSSLAEETAERLGVTGDQLLQLVEQNLRRHKVVLPQGG
ncbi:MAG TPA: DNA mismatch repair protein [Polyangium sp.]|nr:DNA mismatch repair protein [Polyangium sp.]